MQIFGSRPGSRVGSRRNSPPSTSLPGTPRRGSAPSSRGVSPTRGKYDSISIQGNLYDVLKPRPAPTHFTELLPKELHVTLRYTASFTLTKPVYATSIKATYRETMIVVTDPGDGQFREPFSEEEEIASISIEAHSKVQRLCKP